MRTISQALIALGFVGAMAVSTPVTVKAQGAYYYGPGVSVEIGPRYRYDRRYYRDPYNSYGYYPGYNPSLQGRQVDRAGTTCFRGVCCPRGYSNQDGVCKPYRGF